MAKIVVAARLEETEVLPGNANVVANIENNHVTHIRLTPSTQDSCSCGTYKANAALMTNNNPSCEHLKVLRGLGWGCAAILIDNKLYAVLDSCTMALSVLIPRLQTGNTPTGVVEITASMAQPAQAPVTMSPVSRSYGLTLLASTSSTRNLGSVETLVDGEVDVGKEAELLAYAEELFKSWVPADRQKKPAVAKLDSELAKYTFPKSDVFYVSEPLKRQLAFALAMCKNLLLCGPSGSGKTEVIREFAKAAGRELVAFNLGAMSEARTSLIGSMTLTEKGTKFIRSKFIEAISRPNTMVLLDELTRAPSDAFNILLPVLDGQKVISIDEEGGTEVEVAEGVVFVATANVGMEYTGTGVLDRALKDRFMIEHVEFPPVEFESAILVKRCGVISKTAQLLVRMANDQRARAKKDDEFSMQISTRMLILTAEQISFGITQQEALEHCVESFFPTDGGIDSERSKVNQISRKFFPLANKTA